MAPTSWPAPRALDARLREPAGGGRLRSAPAVRAGVAPATSAAVGAGLSGHEPGGCSTAGTYASDEDAAVAGLIPEAAGGWADGPNARCVEAPRVAGEAS